MGLKKKICAKGRGGGSWGGGGIGGPPIKNGGKKKKKNEGESPRQRGDEIERGRNFEGMAWFEAWIADFHFSRVYKEMLWCSFFRLVRLMVLEALFSKLRFRIICRMKSHPRTVGPSRPCLWCVFVVASGKMCFHAHPYLS